MSKPLSRLSFPPYRIIPELRDLTPNFLKQTEHCFTQCSAALVAEQYTHVQQLGHQLHGSGASFGFPYFSQIGQAMEIAAAQQDSSALYALWQKGTAYLAWIKQTLPVGLCPEASPPPLLSAQDTERAMVYYQRRRGSPAAIYHQYGLRQLGQVLNGTLKRTLDVLGAATLLTLLTPLLAAVALAIWLEDRGPVLFMQQRVGKDGRCFHFYKFRSMVPQAEALKDRLKHLNESQDGVIFKARRDPRITRVGRWIRRFSIDELPQLYNVLKGDMSLVGPRPPLPSEVELYTPGDRKRLHVTPGLTCIWQVSGRSEIPFHQQVKLDQQYIQQQNLRLDLVLLLQTLKAVVSGRGAY
jgi:lipopolysaccharide/colanic/teichoic acid biosynthesis glycosyltransferase/HPt (histidine-containing phosphotransfer) domain-containing protein